MMKNFRLKLNFIWLLLFICMPLTAHANAIIPYMIVPWGQVFLFPIVILVEAIILRILLHDKFRPVLFQTFIANLASTILGILLFILTIPVFGNLLFEWSFKGAFSSETMRNAIIAFVFAVVLWTLSWLIERAVLVRMRKESSVTTVSLPCAAANLVSYILLLTLSIWFGIASTSVEAHVDTTRNSSNIEAFLKPDKNLPYIGFWKSDCKDDVGLAIEATSDGKYTVAFCGPGGCDRVDNLPHTTLTDDPNYRIINSGSSPS